MKNDNDIPVPWWRDVRTISDAAATNGVYKIWNYARYTFENLLQNGEQRWQCTVVLCKNSIFLNSFGEFIRYVTHTDSRITSSKKRRSPMIIKFVLHHKANHERWDDKRIIAHNALQDMIQQVQYGSHPTKTYQQMTTMDIRKCTYITFNSN